MVQYMEVPGAVRIGRIAAVGVMDAERVALTGLYVLYTDLNLRRRLM